MIKIRMKPNIPTRYHKFPYVGNNRNPRSLTGTWSGYMGALFISEDWQVRVICSSGLVDRPSGHLYVHTITMSGCMDRLSCYVLFYSQAWMDWHKKTCTLSFSPEELSPYRLPLQGPLGAWKFSDKWTAWDITHTKTISSNNWEDYNLDVNWTLITRFHCTQKLRNTNREGFLNASVDFCWLDYTRWSYRHPLGLNIFAENLQCG